MALVQAGTAKPQGVTNPTGALTLTPSPLTSTATAPKVLTVLSGSASVGVLKPVVGASATLAPAQPVKATPAAVVKPAITESKIGLAAASASPASSAASLATVQPAAEQRALPRPDSVPSLSWKTVALLAAAGLGAYLIFHG